jgi:hypothetical protein
MPDRQGFSDKDIETLHRPNKRKATRASPRTPAPSASPVLVHAANDAAPVPALDAQAPTTGDEAEDPILEATDKALATFSSKRQLLMILLLLFLQKQSLAFAVYLFGIGTLLSRPGKRRIFRARMESEMRGHNLA